MGNGFKLIFHNYQDRKDFFIHRYTDILGEEIVNGLMDTGFLTAPASTRYHGNYEGGLFDHSVNVAMVLNDLTIHNKLLWESGKGTTSAYKVGILHDLCKIDQYNKQEDGTYKWSDEPIIKGHGMKSLVYTQIMKIELTAEEVACIVYHMGAFTDSQEWQNYTNAVEKYPNVLWTHHADMIVSHVLGV